MEVIWKLCASITNNRSRTYITLHYALHNCRQERGEGTATMEENIAQQIAGCVMNLFFRFSYL